MTATLDMVTASPEETQALGRLLGREALPGDLFLLTGELGSGKTCLVQGIAQGLGSEDAVRSPTFVLVTQYRGRLMLYHIDLYRVDDLREVEELGLEEYLEGEGVCAVEWAEKGRPLFPERHLRVTLEHRGPQERVLHLEGRGLRYTQLLERIAEAGVAFS